jgi:nitrogen fixation NifU-like protein
MERGMKYILPEEKDGMPPEPAREDYGAEVIDHGVNPRNMELPERADGRSRFTGPCGDTVEIWIEVKDGILERAYFQSDGCLTTIACGSMVTELARGRTISQAMEIGQVEVLEALRGLPGGSEHCALLAATAMKLAIADYLAKKEEPWRKDYERT